MNCEVIKHELEILYICPSDKNRIKRRILIKNPKITISPKMDEDFRVTTIACTYCNNLHRLELADSVSEILGKPI